MISASEKVRFERVCRDMLLADRQRDGIGTLSEKRLHSTLKSFICDDKGCHEIKVYSQLPTDDDTSSAGGRESCYVADVLRDCDIFEIQTAGLAPLKAKIAFYLSQTDYNVTVIHPLAVKKRINYMSPFDGTVVRRAISPKKERPEDMLPELYPLIPFLGNRRLHLKALLLEVEEFRIMSKSGKRRAQRYERIPVSLVDAVELDTPADFLKYVPADLVSPFTAAEFGKAAGYRGIDIYSALRVLIAVGLIREEGKRGRAATFIKV